MGRVPLDPAELEQRLEDHREWLETDGASGVQADLTARSLDGADLGGRRLGAAVMRGASLHDVRLEKADLSEADLVGADLTRAELSGCRLEGTQLQRATLRHARLRRARFLLAEQVAGADLAGAHVPPGFLSRESFEDLEDAMKNSRAILFATLLACAYSLLTVFDTSDVDLLTNTRALALPIVGASVPVSGFFVAAPLLLLILFGYLHQKLGSILRKAARLPAVFPDGRRLYEGVYPWILGNIVHESYRALHGDGAHTGRLAGPTSAFIGWAVVPLTVVIIWGRYLARHDPLVTVFHVVLASLVVVLAVASYREGRALMRRAGQPQDPWTWAAVAPVAASGLALGLGLGLLSYLATTGHSRLPHVPPFLNPYASLTREDLRPSRNGDTTGGRLDLTGVNLVLADARDLIAPDVILDGAILRRARFSDANLDRAALKDVKADHIDLTHGSLIVVDAKGAHFPNGELRGACLQGADLSGADLTDADLRGADLTGADLARALLQGAKLDGARLDCTNLVGAWLEGAQLQDASLTGADLTGAHFQGARLRRARLDDVRAPESDFSEAHLVGAVLSRGDFTGARFENTELSSAWLERATLQQAILPSAALDGAILDGADLDRAQLQGAQLASASLRNARLFHADLTGANLNIADLARAKLQQAIFRNAGLNGAILDGAVVEFASFGGASLEGAHLARSTGWERAHLEGLKTLDRVSCAAGEDGTDHAGLSRPPARTEAPRAKEPGRCRKRAQALRVTNGRLAEVMACPAYRRNGQ